MIKYRTRTRPPDLADFISSLPRNTRGIATEAAAEYIVGDKSHGLKHYPRYKYITRKRAYGKTFVSASQRRYVMAGIRAGRITPGYPRRTGQMQRGWEWVRRGTKTVIQNTEGAAKYVFGDSRGLSQAKLNELAGWRKMTDIAESNMNGAIRAADREVQKYINKKAG